MGTGKLAERVQTSMTREVSNQHPVCDNIRGYNTT